MRHLLALTLILGLVAGCGTTAEQQVLSHSNIGPDTVKALQDLKAAIQPIIVTVANDAKATRAWANQVLGPTGSSPDPVKYALANACPTATDAVAGLINGTIDGMIAQVTAITSPPDTSLQGGLLMLQLTQLKYGAAPDPKTQLAALQAQFNLQMDALFTGCQHLFPKKQMNDIINLMAKAGITGFSGGALGPLMGIVP